MTMIPLQKVPHLGSFFPMQREAATLFPTLAASSMDVNLFLSVIPVCFSLRSN
jgi:hypothetical protein